jgi:hypothetical protein
MMVDAYRILTDQMTSYWRLDKPLKRFPKLLKYYPLESNIFIVIENPINDDVIRFLRKKIIRKSKLVVVGFYAFDYYAKKESVKAVLSKLPFLEAITTDYNKDTNHIYRHLKKKFGNNITVKEFSPFITFTDKRVEYYYNNKLVLRLYGNNTRCTVYNYSDKKKVHFGTYNLVFMYLLFSYYYAYINRNKEDTNLYLALLSKLHKIRNSYLESHGFTVIDPSPFQDFTMKCFGTPVDSLRESRIEGAELKKKKFRYHPSGKPGKAPELNFSNTSGNQILNEKYLVIKK